MSKNNFNLDNWFLSDREKNSLQETLPKKAKTPQEILAPFYPENKNNPNLLMQQYFVPGWKGESLISKNVKDFKTLLVKLQNDAFKALKTKSNFPKKMIGRFYDEFLSFSEFMAFSDSEIDNASQFWNEFRNEESEFREFLDLFGKILAYRIAIVFILKARFVIILNQQTKKKIHLKDIVYPVSFLNRFFKSASSTELKSKAFEQNIYSWYRPGEHLSVSLQNFAGFCLELTITDIIKTISIGSESILKAKADYSHTISHKNFGLFLNNILINFPMWLDSVKNKKNKKFCTLNNLEIISCKYIGDYLESLSLSHWLAQESNKHEKWDQILCPDFIKDSFDCGNFLSIVNELQFLSFLAQISFDQGWDPKTYISHIANSHLYNRKELKQAQRQLIHTGQEQEELTYDRVIINLCHYPNNNPHHYVFTQASKEINSLKEEGFIYVLSQKQLFIPSQKSKVESLLQKYKLEGMFNLEEIKGKGEIVNYIYVFSKKNALKPIYGEEKNSCYNFRVNAELDTFQNFSTLTRLTQDFFLKNFKDVPPLYQKQEDQFRLEFYQDAIVNGQLIHSSSKDTKNITHPFFFERLMKTCHPLSYFYDIQRVNFEDDGQDNEEDTLFNFSTSFKKEVSPYCFIVDKRNREDIRIELIESSKLESISHEYGHVQCSYFYAYPKWNHLDNNTLAEYFRSSIGQQIVRLTFSNEIRKTKGNLQKILIPTYFTKGEKVPDHLTRSFSFFVTPSADLLEIHPSEILKTYQQTIVFLKKIATEYPSSSLKYLSHFKKSLFKCVDMIGLSHRKTKVNFANPLFKTPLVLAKKSPIFPDNQDVYIEFNSDRKEDIHQALTHTKKFKDENGHSLAIYAHDNKILTLHSDEEMLSFLDFLLGNMKSYPISKIIQSVQVPSLADLKSIFESYNSQVKAFESLIQDIPQDFDQVLSTTIFSS